MLPHFRFFETENRKIFKVPIQSAPKVSENKRSDQATKTKSACWQLVRTFLKRWKTRILTATASQKYKGNLLFLENPHALRRCSGVDSFYQYFKKYSNELCSRRLWFCNPEGTLFSLLSLTFMILFLFRTWSERFK